MSTILTATGLTMRFGGLNFGVMADVEARFWERFQPDGAGISLTLRGMAEAMGSEMFYKNHCIPSVKTPRVRKPEDV